MIKKINLFTFFFFFLIGCSFDDKTGIWSGGIKEKKRISELEKKQNRLLDVEKTVYLSDEIYSKEILLTKKIILSKPKKNLSWKMSGLNNQNFLGHIYLSGSNRVFFKKKIAKNKFSIFKVRFPPLIYNNNIFVADDKGNIFKTDLTGRVKWKINIYKNIYKKIYKTLNLSINNNNIYVADNIGFLYSISIDTGKVIWIKNHGVPFKSHIKIYKNKIFIINQDNRILSFSSKDGSLIWDIRSIKSFIKSQFFLSLSVSQQGELIALNSSGDLFKINSENGNLYWSVNVATSLFAHATDFFKSSLVVINNNDIIFSSGKSIFCYNLENGSLKWENEVSAFTTPILDGNNIFIVTENGYLVILDKISGKIIFSTNILNVLKKRKQETTIKGFMLGSNKIYSFTSNGHLIINSATTGNVEGFKKIADSVNSFPIASDGKLYITTDSSRIVGLS